MSGPPPLRPPAGRQGPGPISPPLVQALDLALARRAGGYLPGEHMGPGAAAGTELAQLRPYQVGDDVRQLDPAATARTGIAHVRLQVPERLLTTWVLLDVSASMAFGTAQRLKADVAEGAAQVLGRLATRRGGRVALLAFGAPARRFLPPRGGRGALVAFRKLLEEGTSPDGHEDGGALLESIARIGRLARQPGLVAILSDFRGPRDWRVPLAGLARRHSVLAVEVRDPREASLPAVGRLALVDPESGRRVEVNTRSRALRERYERAEQAERDAVARDLRRARARHAVLSTDGPWLEPLGRALR